MSSGKSREFKVSADHRILSGENVSALARELQVLRKDLYKWRDNFRSRGAAGLRGRGRPRKSEQVGVPEAASPPATAPPDELARAKQRIAELERKIGQQHVEPDFFSASLAASQGNTPAERRAWRQGVYAIIEAMTTPLPQGGLSVERLTTASGRLIFHVFACLAEAERATIRERTIAGLCGGACPWARWWATSCNDP